jgi:sulfur carrier protein ThiS
MSVELRLVGFGDDVPASFLQGNPQSFELPLPATPNQLLKDAGIEDTTGLVMMGINRVIPESRWHESLLVDGDQMTLFSAIEGG